jgi:hypothetical protein
MGAPPATATTRAVTIPADGAQLAGAAQLRCERRLEIVPRATHLFEEPGALDTVAELARDWFRSHLGNDPKRGAS